MPSENPLQRVQDILESIDLIQKYTYEAGGVDSLLSVENMAYDAVERRLLIIAEAATKLRSLVEELEPDIPWQDIRSIGNIIRHNYDDVNAKIIRSVLVQDLEPLKQACLRLVAHFSD